MDFTCEHRMLSVGQWSSYKTHVPEGAMNRYTDQWDRIKMVMGYAWGSGAIWNDQGYVPLNIETNMDVTTFQLCNNIDPTTPLYDVKIKGNLMGYGPW